MSAADAKRLERIAALHAEGHGDRHIAGVLKITRHAVRNGLLQIAKARTTAITAAASMARGPLELYHALCQALADAKLIEDVLPLLDQIEHVKLYAKQVRNQELKADAEVYQLRAERRLGEIIAAAKAEGHFTQGHRVKNTGTELLPRATLNEVGVDKKLSARAQKYAAQPTEQFDLTVESAKERISSGSAHVINGARSIMGSRQEPDDSLDFFPTPPWATRALIEHVFEPYGGLRSSCEVLSVWEPACGAGHMAEVLKQYFRNTVASDIHDYGYGKTLNFLGELESLYLAPDGDWIITNPPFGDKSEQFVLRALGLAKVGVAMFFRLQWLESVGRYERVFAKHPPRVIAQFAERVPLHKGRWEPDGTTATAYLWIVWLKDWTGPTEFMWIPPGQREALTHPTDRERFGGSKVQQGENADADLPIPGRSE